jgi:hypothetical protein
MSLGPGVIFSSFYGQILEPKTIAPGGPISNRQIPTAYDNPQKPRKFLQPQFRVIRAAPKRGIRFPTQNQRPILHPTVVPFDFRTLSISFIDQQKLFQVHRERAELLALKPKSCHECAYNSARLTSLPQQVLIQQLSKIHYKSAQFLFWVTNQLIYI